MKLLKTLSLITLILLITSCEPPVHTEPEFVGYNLYLSFQDSSGTDLAKGIEYNRSLGAVVDSVYTLDIIIAEPCWNWDNDIYNAPPRPGFEPDVNRQRLGLSIYKGYSYLTNQFGLPLDDCPKQEILIYQMKCPYLFGDNTLHELVTYWDIPKDERDPSATCYRIEFEGQEITPNTMNEYSYVSTAILILE